MSWKDRAALAVAGMAGGELPKPPKGASVSFVSAPPPTIPPAEDAAGPGPERESHAGPGAAIADPAPSPLTGLECNGCANLEMRQEWHTGTRKRYFWRCTKGHEVLEGRNYGERVTLAPPECEEAGSFEQWKAGIR